MKKHTTTVLLILMLFAGLSLLLYPYISNRWNDRVHTKAIATYMEAVKEADNGQFTRMLEQAEAYNRELVGKSSRFRIQEQEQEAYRSLLNITPGGAMAYIEIPAMDALLPIYHSTESAVLQAGIGHLAGSSLPVGGQSTHCVLSGHRGLPTAKLFTNLNRLQQGDLFYIHVMDRLLTYQVEQVLIVLPHQLEPIDIVPGQDWCTLLTCTPYGVNTHRLMVQGRRVENPQEQEPLRLTAEAVELDPLLLAPVIATPILLLLLLILLLKPKKKKHDFDHRKGV